MTDFFLKKIIEKTLLFQVPSITGNKPNEADPFLKLSQNSNKFVSISFALSQTLSYI